MAKKHVEFDPVKKLEDANAQAVVWSTVSLNAAVEAKKKGLPLKVNPFYDNDIQLLKPDLVFRRTAEEVKDWLHCKEDKVYFGNKCHMKTPAGVQQIVLRDYQEDYLRLCEKENYTVFLAARQSAKSTSSIIDMLHQLLFNNDINALVVSKSGPNGQDVITKMKEVYRYLPWHLKAGINIWNVQKVAFDNNSVVWYEPPSTTAGVSSTCNYLLLDEFAWLPLSGDDVDLYWSNILPVVSQDSDAKIRVCSTQNGFNKFYKIYMAAVKGESEFKPFKVDWHQVPQYNKKTKTWEKRTEEWKKKEIKKMGSEEAFYYMYGTVFSASDFCLASRERLTKLHEREHLFRELTEEEKESIIMTEAAKLCFRIHKDFHLSDLKKKNCVVLVDLAEGGGGDSTVFHIFEVILENGNPIFEEIAYWKANKIDLEEAALVFWIMCQTIFTPEWFIASVELNTYGVLFENYVVQLNESDYKPEWNWRFSAGTEFDYTCLAGYKKTKEDEDLPGMKKTNSKTIPGIRWNSSNKPASCMLLKGLIEKDIVRLYDITCISELEAFEDKTGKGHYKASYGHDDLIMTCVQIPKLMETAKWKGFLEEIPSHISIYSNSETGPSIYDEMSNIRSPFNSMFANDDARQYF